MSSRQLLEALPVALVRLDADGRLREANRRFMALLGRSQAELIGATLAQLQAGDAGPEGPLAWHRLGGGGSSCRYLDLPFRLAGGEVRDLRFSVADECGGDDMLAMVEVNGAKTPVSDSSIFDLSARHSTESIYWSDDDGNICFVNDRACETTGYSRAELLSMRIWDLDPSLDADSFRVNRELLHRNGHRRSEAVNRYKDGRIVPVEFIATSIEFEGRRYALSFVRDISERVRAQEALVRNERQYREVFDGLLSGAVVHRDFRILHRNRSLDRQLFGPAAAAVKPGDSILDWIAPDDRERFVDAVNSCLTAAAPMPAMAFRATGADDKAIFLLAQTHPIEWQGRPAALTEFQDVTGLKSAMDDLRESETRFRSLVELTSDWYWEQDRDFRFTFRSGAVLDAMGIPPEEDYGKKRWEMDSPNMSEADWARHRAVLERREEFRDLLLQRSTRAGMVWSKISGRPIFDDSGNFTGYRGTGRDVTREINAELELQTSVKRLRTIIENVPIILYAFDKNGIFTVSEGKGLEVLGRTPGQLVGESIHETLPENSAAQENFRRAMAGERFTSLTAIADRHFSIFHAPLHNDATGELDGSMGVLLDVTEQIEAEAQLLELNRDLERRVEERGRELRQAHDELIRNEKLASLGGMVAGVAHELNTPIGTCITMASILAECGGAIEAAFGGAEMPETAAAELRKFRDGNELIVRNLQRAGSLIRSFKQVAVDQASEQRRTFDLRDVVEETVSALLPTVNKAQCRIEVAIAADIAMDSYPGALSQILTNLISNAIVHGFEGRNDGIVHIEARRAGETAVELSCRDNGCGIPAENLSRVFDPFFTTRRGGGGSGLGLHLLHNLTTEVLGGSVRVRSEPEAGACFSLTLPLSAPRGKTRSD